MVSENAGWAAAQAVVIGIMEREATGLGQHVETSLLDAAVNLMQWATAAESSPDEWKGKQLAGYTEPPDHGFRCKDAHFLLDMGRVEEEWKQFCLAVGADSVAYNPLYDSFAKRLNWMPVIREEMAPALADWTFDDLEKLARGMGATIVRMNTFESLMDHPQVEALEMVRELEHPVVGKYRTLDIPWDFSEPIARLATAPAETDSGTAHQRTVRPRSDTPKRRFPQCTPTSTGTLYPWPRGRRSSRAINRRGPIGGKPMNSVAPCWMHRTEPRQPSPCSPRKK